MSRVSRYVAEVSIGSQPAGPGWAHVSSRSPEAGRNLSRSRLSDRAAPGVVRGTRGALAGAGFVGVLLLAIATFATIIEITVAGSGEITAKVDRELSGYDRHSLALLLIGGAALVMHVTALRGARPAMLAVAVCGLTVLLIALLGDAPDLDDVGPIGELYEDARAQAGTGFYLETLGGALLLVAGVGMLVVGGRGAAVLGGVPRRSVEPGAGATDPDAPARDEADGTGPQTPSGPSAAQRLASGAGARVAAAREARTAQQARKAQRDDARRAREAERAQRDRDAAAQAASERDAAAQAASERDAQAQRDTAQAELAVTQPTTAASASAPVDAPEPDREPAAPRPDAAGDAPPTFEERLRQAKERAGRRPT